MDEPLDIEAERQQLRAIYTDLGDAAEPLIEHLLSVIQADDPVQVAKQLQQRFERDGQVCDWMAQHQRRALAELRARGLSYTDIARLLRVSRSRAAQLCKELPRGDRPSGSR